MVTNAFEDDEPTEMSKISRVTNAVFDAGSFALTGSASGRVRRPILFTLVAIGIAVPLPALSFVALLLLALTDAVVEL